MKTFTRTPQSSVIMIIRWLKSCRQSPTPGAGKLLDPVVIDRQCGSQPPAYMCPCHICTCQFCHTHKVQCVKHTHTRTEAVRTMNAGYFCHMTRGMKRLSDPITRQRLSSRHPACECNPISAGSDRPQLLTVNVGQRWRLRAAAGDRRELFTAGNELTLTSYGLLRADLFRRNTPLFPKRISYSFDIWHNSSILNNNFLQPLSRQWMC